MLTVGIESLSSCLDEVVKIFPSHWDELALFKDKMPLSPKYQELFDLESRGAFFAMVMRLDGVIIGYYSGIINSPLHYSETSSCMMDICYIVPEYRNRGYALKLFAAVKEYLRRRRVKVWYSGYKASNPLGMPKLLSRLGFSPSDSYMAMWIGD